MTLRRRDIPTALFASAAASIALTRRAEAQGQPAARKRRTPAEVAAKVTPTDYSYPADPYIDPRRYGADPTGSTDSTSALQAALDVAYQCKGAVWIGNGCSYLCGALSLLLTGNRNSDGIRIMGSSVNGSRLIQHGSPEAILTFRGSAPSDHPQECPIVLENFSIVCSGKTTDGIVLHGVAAWTIRKVYIGEARRAIWLHFALTGLIEECWLHSGINGIYATDEGPVLGCNLVTVRNCIIDGHSSWGIDFGAGDRLKIEACDMEGNGTPGKTNTGALVLRANVGSATGCATADLDGVWFESNFGQTLSVESNGRLTLAIRNTNWYSDENANALLIAGATAVSIEDSFAPTAAGDIWNITANALFLKNVVVHTLIDSGVKLPTYSHVVTGTAEFGNGRSDSFAGTLTGVKGKAATASISIRQQGDEVELNFFSPLVGQSDAVTCTITGLPPRYRPKHDTMGIVATQDNGVTQALACLVSASTGTITLGYAHDFKPSGAKGIMGGQIRMRLL
jgi:hypothetical protein